MTVHELDRREFLLAGAAALAALPLAMGKTAPKPIVGIARIRNDRIEAAVEEAIDLLGGIRRVTRGKDRVLLKPNLVFDARDATTKPEVVRPEADRARRDRGARRADRESAPRVRPAPAGGVERHPARLGRAGDLVLFQVDGPLF